MSILPRRLVDFILVMMTLFLRFHIAMGVNDTRKPRSIRNRLIEDLLEGYHPGSLPTLENNELLELYITAQIYQIIEVSMASNTIKLTAGITMYWKDSYLTWDPAQYGGLESVYIPSEKVWTPELSIYYSVSKTMSQIPHNFLEVCVKHDGSVDSAVAFTVNSLCPYNCKKFPFDYQLCKIVFGSFIHTTKTMDVFPKGKVGLKNFFDNQEWLLDETELVKDHKYFYDREGNLQTIGVINLIIRMHRQPFYYIFVLVIPATIITFVAVVGFHMPGTTSLNRDSKFQLGQITLLSMSVLLVGVSKELPKFATTVQEGNFGSFSSVPLLGVFYLSLLFLIMLSVITNSILVSFERFVVTHERYPDWMMTCYRGLKKIWSKRCRHVNSLYLDKEGSNATSDVRAVECPNNISISKLSPNGTTHSTTLPPIKSVVAQNPKLRYIDRFGKQNDAVIIQLDLILKQLQATTRSVDTLITTLNRTCSKPKIIQQVVVLCEQIERLLFAFYLIALLIIVLLFFYHDWY